MNISLWLIMSVSLTACSQKKVVFNKAGTPSTATINAPGKGSIITINRSQDGYTAIFDSQNESFTDGFSYTNDLELNVSENQIDYAGTADKQIDLIYDATPFYHLYEYWKITAIVELGAMAANDEGFFIGLKSSNLSRKTGFILKGHSSAANRFTLQPYVENANAGSAISGNVYTPGQLINITIERTLRTITMTVDDGTTPVEATLELGFGPYASNLLPNVITEFNIYFFEGDFSIKDFRAAIPFVGISFAFIGDSITQGQSATTYEGAYAQLLKSIFPDAQAFGGRSSKTADILLTLNAVKILRPQKVTILMGINDLLTGVDNTTTRTNYQDFVNGLIAAGIEPIIISILPYGNGAVNHNNWLQSTFPTLQYINAWAALKNPSTVNMDASYTADGVHPNDLGHAVLAETIENGIAP